jgi:sugar O-acyltransferase (sialic acid O-acetyltransferase NeuD family)
LSRQRIAIVGAGGCARELAWLIRDINREQFRYEFLGYIVSDLSSLGQHDSVEQVLGDFEVLSRPRSGIDALALAIGWPAARLKVAAQVQEVAPQMAWPVLIHPTAQFDRASCKLGRGVVLCAGSIGTVNLTLDDFCLTGVSCTIGHESHIGRGCVLNPGANISGGVTLGEGVLIGTGAQVLQYLEVGSGATVGAGAVVTKDVRAGEKVVGVPASPLLKQSYTRL